MKQEEINKRLKNFQDEIYGKDDALFDRKGNNVSRQVENVFIKQISLAVAEREEQIFSRLKELGCGDAVNVIEMELHYKPKQK